MERGSVASGALRVPAGYTAHPVSPSVDLADAVDLCVAASVAEYGVADVDERMLREAWNLPALKAERDTALVRDAAGTAVALAEYYDGETEHVAPFLFLRVRPPLADSPLTDALLTWARVRAQGNLPLAVPGARVAMVTNVASVNGGIIAALERAGWNRDRVSWTMEIDVATTQVPEPKWPAGITLRTAELPADLRAVHAAERDFFSDHYGFLPQPFEAWVHFRTRFMRPEAELWFLAMDGAEIVGMALCSSDRVGEPGLGWVSTLGVTRRWRQRGLGLAILQHALRELAARGRKRAGLGVDAQSLTGATRLYERAGMRVVREQYEYELLLREGRDLRTTQLA